MLDRPRVWVDTETFNETPITQGTDRYARTAELLITSYAFGDDPVSTWDRAGGEPTPRDLAEYIADPGVLFVAHNATFDMAIFHYAGLGVGPKRWRCTMAQALAHSLPGSLDALCDVFSLSAADAKLKDGKKVMLLFCTPRPKNQKLRRATAQSHPAEWARFVEYCENDVKAMRIVSGKMPTWNYAL